MTVCPFEISVEKIHRLAVLNSCVARICRQVVQEVDTDDLDDLDDVVELVGAIDEGLTDLAAFIETARTSWPSAQK